MLLLASFFSMIVLLLILIIEKKISILFQSKTKDLLRSALVSLLNPFLFYIVLFTAYDLLLTQEAMVINFSWPVTLTIFSVFLLKQKISIKSIVAILISFFGIIVIATEGHLSEFQFSNPTGVGLALGSTVIWSLFWIFNMKDQRDDIIKLFLNFAFGFFYILVYLLILKPADTLINVHINAYLGSIYIGIFEMGLAFVLWLKGLQLSITTAKVSNLIFLAPFISLLIINLTVGEQILWTTLTGLIFIVLGIVLQKWGDRNTG